MKHEVEVKLIIESTSEVKELTLNRLKRNAGTNNTFFRITLSLKQTEPIPTMLSDLPEGRVTKVSERGVSWEKREDECET